MLWKLYARNTLRSFIVNEIDWISFCLLFSSGLFRLYLRHSYVVRLLYIFDSYLVRLVCVRFVQTMANNKLKMTNRSKPQVGVKAKFEFKRNERDEDQRFVLVDHSCTHNAQRTSYITLVQCFTHSYECSVYNSLLEPHCHSKAWVIFIIIVVVG